VEQLVHAESWHFKKFLLGVFAGVYHYRTRELYDFRDSILFIVGRMQHKKIVVVLAGSGQGWL
jgi:hypothetical protein